MDDRKSTTSFVFYIEDTTFIWSSKKQSIVTLSTCEAEYVATKIVEGIVSLSFHMTTMIVEGIVNVTRKAY